MIRFDFSEKIQNLNNLTRFGFLKHSSKKSKKIDFVLSIFGLVRNSSTRLQPTVAHTPHVKLSMRQTGWKGTSGVPPHGTKISHAGIEIELKSETIVLQFQTSCKRKIGKTEIVF